MSKVIFCCVLTLCQKFPTMFEHREINTQGNGAFHLVACYHNFRSESESEKGS